MASRRSSRLSVRTTGTTIPDRGHQRLGGYEHPVWGRLEQPGTFIELSETPGRIAGPPPIIGAHTREILSELGYSVLEMANLHEKGGVAS